MKRLTSLVIIFTTLLTTALMSTRTVFANTEKKGTSVLTGVVIGPNDKPVPRASIMYQSSSGSAAHLVRSDAYGRFTVSKLAADNYDLRASANGVFSEWEKNVTIQPGQTRSITLHLIYAKQMPKGSIVAGKNISGTGAAASNSVASGTK
jgi:Carboxypeptidase regulatory-like domain